MVNAQRSYIERLNVCNNIHTKYIYTYAYTYHISLNLGCLSIDYWCCSTTGLICPTMFCLSFSGLAGERTAAFTLNKGSSSASTGATHFQSNMGDLPCCLQSVCTVYKSGNSWPPASLQLAVAATKRRNWDALPALSKTRTSPSFSEVYKGELLVDAFFEPTKTCWLLCVQHA